MVSGQTIPDWNKHRGSNSDKRERDKRFVLQRVLLLPVLLVLRGIDL
jgi:hypothetical protein